MIHAFSQILIAQSRYTFQRIDISSGLQGNSVYSIAQDNKGFIWVGTGNGVQRYDMYEFSAYPEFNQDNKVLVDHSERIWVASNDGVMMRDFRNKKFSHIPVLISGKEMFTFQEQVVREDNRGRIWLSARLPNSSTQTYYLLLYHEEKEQFLLFDAALQKEVGGIVQVTDDQKGNLWMATAMGLVYYDVKTRIFYHYKYNPLNIPLLSNKVFAEPIFRLKSSKNGNLIIITWGRIGPVFHLVKKDQTILREKDVPFLKKINSEIREVRDILVDMDNTIWLAGDILQKINVDHGTYEIVELPEDITIVNSISEDREGNIWLGTYRGILLLDPNQRVQHKYNQAAGEPAYKRETVCLFQTWDGIILAGGWFGGGLFFYDQNLNAIKKFDHFTREDFKDLKITPAWKIIEDDDKNIWIGAQHGNLFKIDRKNRKVLHFHDPAFDSRTIRDICEDTIGNIWFSNQSASIVRWIKKEGRFSKFNKEDYADGFLFFYADKKYIWVSGGSYLFKIDAITGEVTKKYHDELESLSKTKIGLGKIIEASDDKLVISSSGGLVLFDKKREIFHLIKITTGVLNAEVLGKDKYLLVLADGSIVEYNSGSLNFLEKGNHYNSNSSVKLKNDVVIFGGEISMTIVKPKSAKAIRGTMPPPSIMSIQVLNKELNVDSILLNGLSLNYNENLFSITYSALNFQERDDIDYFYRIGTKNKEFINIHSQRTITYAQLPHGDYKFEIFYTLPDGRQSPVTSLNVNVRPPIWRQTWFLMSVAVIVLGIIFLFYWIRLSKIKALAKVREKISRDLHDDMGSNLSTINILSNVAKNSISKPGTDKIVGDILGKISDLSFQAMESVDEIVWSLNPQHDSFEEIVSRMRLLGGEMLENQNINFVFSLEGDPRQCDLAIDRRNDFYMIYKESITNIIKYAKCKNVYASLTIDKHAITLIITDDGIGFNLNGQNGGNGIQNIRARAKNLRGNLSIESKVNTGTRIQIHIPILKGAF